MSELRQRQPVVPRNRKLTAAEKRYERECRERFKAEVLRLDLGRCVGNTAFTSGHACTGPLQAHHAIKQQWLRTYCRTLEADILGDEGWTEDRISEFLWDPANGLTLCDGLHDAHHNGRRIPFEWLPARVVDFADAYRIRHVLEREHPPFRTSVSQGASGQ